MAQIISAGASVSCLLLTGATLNVTGYGVVHVREPGKAERELVVTGGAQPFGPYTVDVRFDLTGGAAGLTFDVVGNASIPGAAGGLVFLTGASGLNNVVTAHLALGWAASAWQWYRRSPSGAVAAISGATSPGYSQQAADIVPGTTIYPTASGLSYSPAGLIAIEAAAPGVLAISGTPVTAATQGSAYAGFTVSASGGVAPYVYSIAASALPTGLGLNTSTGVVSGTPTVASTFAGIVIRVTDSLGAVALLPAFTVVVDSGALAISGTPSASATIGTPYNFTPTVTGGTGSKTFSLIAGTLPAGLSLNTSTGAIAGTPTTAGAATGLSLRVTDAAAATATLATFSITVASGSGDSRARYGVGSATAGVSSAAALLAAMTVYGASNGSKAGTFTVSPGTGQYGWVAIEASAASAGVTFTDSLGTGGWQGASSSGNNGADDGSSPNTSVVTATIGGVTWRFFRQSYAEATGTFTTS